jgi:hypothetical protein
MTALIVGCILVAINHGDVLLHGQVDAARLAHCVDRSSAVPGFHGFQCINPTGYSKIICPAAERLSFLVNNPTQE